MGQRRDTILIVDDERFNLNILQDLLDPQYDIMVAKNGSQALKRAAASPPPDLILLDIMMPAMDGYEVLERLKADNRTKEIPVIFITAMGDSIEEAKGLELGAADYIIKPFSPPVVTARIRTQLNLKWSLERERQLNRKLSQLNDTLADKNEKLHEFNVILKNMASYDGLTGIPNRRRFDEFLDQEWQRSIRNRTPISLIMMDIDFFKFYNDNYGHAAGDECLKQVAQALFQSIERKVDMVARYGGEEFACVLPETDATGAKLVGQRLRSAVVSLHLPHEHSEAETMVTISLGAATMTPEHGNDPEMLIKKADEKLYQAKKEGRNRLVCAISDI
ncbi:GGDEF:Response regulator receiver [Desulfamplus magnetovallimortis]|uniref:diguanylate cyclase n=1 Tax=Desulfamplus magnetovallimortis TaxID=1246637 RepID=A0A1W1HG39_9BACT|nr:diguanylate cyclase [Desulfamplus magnetovallimortis]SLM31352.1 GGDEF:Response regulator receiver [Desulfamplus magnetovallimortis]